MARPLAEFVVLVLAADTEVGRAVALAVAARGARVVAAGEHERLLGEVVGEVAFSGGLARHAVGGVAEGQAKARASWGRVDFVIAPDELAARADPPEAVAEGVAESIVAVVADETGGGKGRPLT